MTSADAKERLRAVNDLRKLEKQAVKAIPLLVNALNDDSSDVRGCAVRALADLDIDCPGTVGSAAQVAVPALRELLKGDDESVQQDAARILGSIGPAAASAVPQIATLLGRAGEAEASWLVNSLAKLGPVAVPRLIAALGSRKTHIRSFAASGLGKIGPAAAAAVPDLVKALNDKAVNRTYVTMALGEIASNAKVAVPVLMKLLNDEEHEVRRAAVTSLGQFGPAAKAAVPKLLPFLEETDWLWWQFLAAQALGRIGPAASPALEPLQNLLTSKNRQIREESQNSIRLISGSPIPSEETEKRKKPGPGDSMFDFARTKHIIAQMLKEGIARFAREHPDEEVACVALFSPGFSASTCLCIGTPKEVPADLNHGGAYDFKYSEYGSEDFEWWPDLYNVGSSFTIKLPDGKVLHRSTDKNGNDAIDKPLFKLLIEILTGALPFKGLKLAKGFRVGVEIHDSTCIRFWSPK